MSGCDPMHRQWTRASSAGAVKPSIGAKFYDLNRETREDWPVATEVGAWGGAEFVRVIQRHNQRLAKYPSEPPAYGVPYDGISNLRPESKAAVEAFLFKQKTPQM